jgi:hypothetical protein
MLLRGKEVQNDNIMKANLQTESIINTGLFSNQTISNTDIIQCLEANPNFHTLEIDQHSKSGCLALSEIFKSSAISTKIKAVHLWVYDSRFNSEIFDTEIWQIMFELIQNIKTRIREMVLDFDFTYSDRVASNIYEYIRENVFNNLRDLIQNQQLETLAVNISNLGANRAESLSIIKFLNDIGNTNVKSFEFDFPMEYLVHLSDDNFQSILEAISSLSKRLSSICLSEDYELYGLGDLSSESFNKFISFLSNLTQLQKFALRGTGIGKLDKERFEQLLTALSKLIQLKRLVIDNNDLEKLSDLLFQQLCQTISKLKKIKYLTLDTFDEEGFSQGEALALTGIPNNLPELYYFYVLSGGNACEWSATTSKTVKKFFDCLEYSTVENIGEDWVGYKEDLPDVTELFTQFNQSAAIKARQKKREIRQDLVEYCILIDQIQRQNPDFKKLTRAIIHHIIEYIDSDFSKKQATDLFDFVSSNGREWKTTQHKNGSNYRFFQPPVSNSEQDVHFYALVRIHTAQDIESLHHFYLKLLDGLSYDILNVKKTLAAPNEPYQFADLFTKIAGRALELANAVGYKNISQHDAENFYQPLLALEEIGKRKRPSETLLEIFNGNLLDAGGAGMAKCHKII